MTLAPCPCGVVPDSLCINDGECAGWKSVCGSCCNEWSIEVRVGYYDDEETIMAKCVEAWNSAPRGKNG